MAHPKIEFHFRVARLGCSRCKQVVDMKKGIVYNYCQLLADYKCKTTACYADNCPVVLEKIDPDKIGYDPRDPDGEKRATGKFENIYPDGTK